MGLEAVFQYIALFSFLSFPLWFKLFILPFDITRWIENYRTKHERRKKDRHFSWTYLPFWVFSLWLILGLLFYTGAMFEVVRFGGTYTGWTDNLGALFFGTLGAYFSIIWIPYWMIPIESSYYFNTTISQFLANFFSWIAAFWFFDYTNSAWFAFPLCIFNLFIFISEWRYEEMYETVFYKGHHSE